MRRTKIICTLGPASDKIETLKQMVEAGMNVARLNFSHGTHAYHKKLMTNVRKVAKSLDKTIAIMQDLQGPKIRVGNMPKRGVDIKTDATVVITTKKVKQGSSKLIPVDYPLLHKDISVGDHIMMVDGLLDFEVHKIIDKDIHCKVINGGKLFSDKGINLPGVALSIAALTDKDKEDLEFGIQNNVDFVALSFVSEAGDVHDLRYLIKDIEKKLKIKNKRPIKIIVKIERQDAVKNFDEILDATDAVMVARGDLGVEIPSEEVPIKQKEIIDKCLDAAKPVIVATQMLDSMIRNPRPTRAETSDVANAVIDHADAVMLSGETATGDYPVKTVETMAKIVERTENSTYDDLVLKDKVKKIESTDKAIGKVAKMLVDNIDAKAIVVASLSGFTARIVSRYRPELPILVSCDDERVRRQMILSWGVQPFLISTCKSVEELVARTISDIKGDKLVKKGDKIILVAGEPVGASGNVNFVEIKEVN
ncbi:MAG TPA: pyruvate kinase [Candidatus Bipolaricaulota bacterium]|nr:pyruvate kinase [Candidatus Bipolaricaulota bacterium]